MYSFSESLHWGSFITTVISINVFWWIWDIPLIWKRGFRAYVDAITWECLRVYMPSVAGVFVIYHTNNRSRWPKLYYFGGRDESLTEGMTDAEVTRIVLTDSLTITATILTISKFYIEPSSLIFTTALWAYPSLQVSLVGIWIVGASYTKTCPRRNILLGGALFIFSVGICIGVILMCLSLAHIQAWLPTTMLYLFMASPFCLYTPGAVIALVMLVATIARVGGLAVTALIPRNAMPSISLKHPLFGTAYLIVGIAGGILAIYGRFRSRHICLVLKQGGAETDVKTSMLSNGIASLNVLQTRIRRKLQGKHVSEKDGEAVGWPQRQIETHRPIIQPPEPVYFSELMAEECTRQPPPAHNTPDVGIRRTISAQQVPANLIQVVNIPKRSESIDSIFFGDRVRAGSIRIKRKPVGSGSLTTIQKPILIPDQQPNNTNNFSDQKVDRTAKQGLTSPTSTRTAARGQQLDNKRRARYFEAEAGKVHVGTGGLQPRQRSLKSKPLPKPPPAIASTVVKLKNWTRGELDITPSPRRPGGERWGRVEEGG